MKLRIVQKYGGTSIGDAQRMLGVVDIVKASLETHDVIIAISAMSSQIKAEGTTSLLLFAADEALAGRDSKEPLERVKNHHYAAIEAAVKDEGDGVEARKFFDEQLNDLDNLLHAISIIQEVSPRTNDAIVSVGERLSARLLTAVLQAADVPAEYVDLSEVCDPNAVEPDRAFWDDTQAAIGRVVEPIIDAGHVPVLTGFLGPAPGGIINAVGRGYTDFTAALAAAALEAEELEIWKEVDGVYTADPRKVESARVLESLTPSEAAELTYFGSEVIHPMTMKRAIHAGVPLRIKNIFKPDQPGTVISDENGSSEHPIKCITTKSDVTVLNIESNRILMAYGFLSRLFDVFARHGVVIDVIATTEVNLSCAINRTDELAEVIAELSALGDVSVQRDMAIVSAVGQGMRSSVGLAGRMFAALAAKNINIEMISQGASEINISCVISNDEAGKAVRTLHAEFVDG